MWVQEVMGTDIVERRKKWTTAAHVLSAIFLLLVHVVSAISYF